MGAFDSVVAVHRVSISFGTLFLLLRLSAPLVALQQHLLARVALRQFEQVPIEVPLSAFCSRSVNRVHNVS